MKKLLVLILVLGLCSTANAATVQIEVNGSDPGSSVSVTTGDTIQLVSYSGSETWNGMILVTNTSNSLADGAVVVANAGDLGLISAYSYAGYGDGYTMAADYLSTAPQSGVQFTMTISGDIDDTGTIVFWTAADWVTPHDTLSYTIIPEPMTIALLGLGGLLLRRRR